jgi:hypothetical protein
MRKILSVIFAVVVWFAVIVQLILMLQNRTTGIPETIIRFFSFFTILTNTLAALYFTAMSFDVTAAKKPGVLTAITAYIFMVGAVYQIVLRHQWQPAGMQLVVDELLHTIIPLLVIIYWYLYEHKSAVKYVRIKLWLIYPIGYLACVLVRGSVSDFYPYPFINVVHIGLTKALINSVILALIFVIIAGIFIFAGKKIMGKKQQPTS